MPDFSLENSVYGQGFSLIAGVDEVGRGPLAGPVFAAAVIFPPDLTGREPWLEALDDSKRLSPAQRDRAVEVVEAHALAIGVAQVGPDAVDSLGIGQASIQAMLQAVENLPLDPTYLLLDYVPLRECPIPFQTIVRGDTLSYSIAAASNVAKVARDRMMREANEVYPGYSFDRNKGYGTAQHLAQLRERGPCQIHRRSFRPVRESLGGRQVD
jgi:ribonuclease HII